MSKTQLAELIAQQMPSHDHKGFGVAVSGGGDSIALLVLMARYAKQAGIALHAISVDHGLRDGTDAELRLVSAQCAKLDVPHTVVHWTGWDGAGNLQSNARDARYDLIAKWAQAHDIDVVGLGHTADDQAETLLMRMARGAGVDGLAAMAFESQRHGVTWLRPLLGAAREDLRDFLRQENVTWAEDPSNENRNFERIRMRDALKELAPLGLNAQTLAMVARNMSDARGALEWHTSLAAKDACEVTLGTVRIDLDRYNALPSEIARRLLVRAIRWVNGANYSPRRGGVSQVQAAMNNGVSSTLDGCQIVYKQGRVYVCRELNAVREVIGPMDGLWDGRWRVIGPSDRKELCVAPLGELGVRRSEAWRELGLPREAILSLPAVWSGGELIASPLIENGLEWAATLERGADTFIATLLSH
jgi:tRNA(Ile)-lysidine synthase